MALPRVLPMEPDQPSLRELEPLLSALCTDPDWIMELKRDGYRCLLFYENPALRLMSKEGNTLGLPKEYLGALADFFRRCGVSSIILDSEIVAYDEQKCMNPHYIRKRGAKRRIFAFDLLYLNGRDFRSKPLLQRKVLLRKVVEIMCQFGKFVRYVPHAASVKNKQRGVEKVFEKALEGVVFKFGESPYDAGLSHAWLKFKNREYPYFRQGFKRRS